MKTLKDLLESEAKDVFLECSVENWDGYEAKAVTEKTYRAFLDFLKKIPNKYLKHSIGANPHGDMTLEFYQGKTHVLSITVDENSEVNYAVLVGNFKENGKESIDSLKKIKDILDRYFVC